MANWLDILSILTTKSVHSFALQVFSARGFLSTCNTAEETVEFH